MKDQMTLIYLRAEEKYLSDNHGLDGFTATLNTY